MLHRSSSHVLWLGHLDQAVAAIREVLEGTPRLAA
jgi:hypothetical protein